MLIVTNCLTENSDEGCLNVAKNLIKRIKKACDDTVVVTYERESVLSDKHIKLNKFLLNKSLYKVLKENKSTVLYIPFPARTFATALRIFVLSFMSKQKVKALLVMKDRMGFIAKLLLKLSGADVIVLSDDAQKFYSDIIGKKRVTYLKTGVDTDCFVPVTDEEKARLKIKYGFSDEKPVILHVGHLNEGRGVRKLLKFTENYQVLLVTSTLTKMEQDLVLKEELLSDGVKIIDDYIEKIQEVYQMADIYFFSVQESGRCIDVPLSCLEAAACGMAVVTTAYGEMRAFKGKNGFFFIDTTDEESLPEIVGTAQSSTGNISREAVLEYDWNNALNYFKSM